MANNNRKSLAFSTILKILSPAILIYGAFFSIRLLGYQPPTDSGLGDFITALYFLFGASLAYFMFLIHTLGKLPASKPSRLWWFLSSMFLMYIAFDETFMIHEYVCYYLNTRDLYLFMIYGAILVSLIFVIRNKLARMDILLFTGFVVLSGISVMSDTLMGEGMINIYGHAVSFEQISESFAAFSLASAFASVGVRQLMTNFGQGQKVIDSRQSRDVASGQYSGAK